jgi:predicted metal-dependent hydrolase
MTKSRHQDNLVDAPQPIVRRLVDIDFDVPYDRPWFPPNETIEQMLNTASLFFPAGEKFLIESVRHYQPQLEDPVLKDQASRFVFQEAMHSRQHDVANEVLKQYHKRGVEVERLAQRHLAFSASRDPTGASPHCAASPSRFRFNEELPQ